MFSEWCSIAIVFGILLVFNLLEQYFKNSHWGGSTVGLNPFPPGPRPDYVDNDCNFSIVRGKPVTDPDSGMTQPSFRPCGLNHIFIQNCTGQFLTAVEAGQPAEWRATSSKASCFLVDDPLNPFFKERPGYYCSLRSVAFEGHYLALKDDVVILERDPRDSEECTLCERPAFKEFVFQITRGYARFNRAFSIITHDGRYARVSGDNLKAFRDAPDSRQQRIRTTFYFGPNMHILAGKV